MWLLWSPTFKKIWSHSRQYFWSTKYKHFDSRSDKLVLIGKIRKQAGMIDIFLMTIPPVAQVDNIRSVMLI